MRGISSRYTPARGGSGAERSLAGLLKQAIIKIKIIKGVKIILMANAT